MRALPKTTMVDRTPHALRPSSALANSSRKRTPRIESPSRKSWSSAAGLNEGEVVWAAFDGPSDMIVRAGLRGDERLQS